MNAAGYDFVITHPEGYELALQFVGNARVEYDQRKALEGADFSLCQELGGLRRPRLRKGAQPRPELDGGRRKDGASPMTPISCTACPCGNMIVTDEVIESPRSW